MIILTICIIILRIYILILIINNIFCKGMIKMMEHRIYIRCLKRDFELIREVIEPAKKIFCSLLEKELDGLKFDIECKINEQFYLDERKLTDTSKVSVTDMVTGNIISKTDEDKSW